MTEDEERQTSLDTFSGAPPRTLNLPSEQNLNAVVDDSQSSTYHDLDSLYPNAPVPKQSGGLVLHRATLHDVTGVNTLLDWLADGEAVIVEMERLMSRGVELTTALEQLTKFIELDTGGQIVRLTDTRLMLLPPGCRGVRGVETEAFASDMDDLL
ncbi:MAG: hypothetical protein QGI21_01235 [Candidatus Poseidoniaceae archaeon]|jgi:SepF-like predicted cell division protein (DUF552 family)|nr:hypothetical protein [Candidatus Poseidoniaceae archaeon]